MALVLVPTALRQLTGGESRVAVHGGTLGACIDELERRFPGMHDRLVDHEGEVQPQIAIYVGGDDVRTLQDLGTPVRPDDEIAIVPAIAGG